ncbi:lytic transglycosylase domain-containing protein [Tabrizicola sp.]|uniref:lytic transglycosylase domain-containing protein n=1 Tax=Tabrizicola sp. TaxID=2005166 RepID=UPI00286CBF29|nr:lytic transglycosylase domain-containing protein [Tabrizicola sp.]
MGITRFRQPSRLLAAIFAMALALPGNGTTDPSGLCLAAATEASDQTGVPRNVLFAIALVESGQTRKGERLPWPWTINQGGNGQWFDTKADAAGKAQAALDLGATNVDLGCFQLNYRWHAEHFASLDDMLDPQQNALYAASFLARLYGETGSWSDAAAAYHSRTPDYADRYRAKFDTALATLDGSAVLVAEAEVVERLNRFPLLQHGGKGAFGSLVPARNASTRLIGAP